MKLKLLFIAVCFSIGVTQAQFTVKDGSDNPIVDGQVVEFAQATYPEASLDFFVTNTGANPIRTKILFVSAVNADGSQMELCYGLCYTGITIGNIYPPASDYIEIQPGETTGQGNHFLNLAGGTAIRDYVFKFFEIDNSGNEIGTPITFTYRYNPNLGVNDFNKLDVTLKSTVISGTLQASASEKTTLTIYNLLGKEVLHKKLNQGTNLVDLSNLSAQLYIVKFTNEKGASKVFKIILK